MNNDLPMAAPDDINSVLDLLKYAWVVGIYWINKLIERIKTMEDKLAVTPTLAEVEARVDKELARVITKLDRLEALIIGMMQKPDIFHKGDN